MTIKDIYQIINDKNERIKHMQERFEIAPNEGKYNKNYYSKNIRLETEKLNAILNTNILFKIDN